MFKKGSFVLAFALVAALLTPLAASAAPPGPTLVEKAIELNTSDPFAGEFDTLIAAVLAADPAVLAILNGNGQKTVFAPSDGAFEALGLTPDNIGDVPQEALTQILLYHVANGRRYSDDIVTSDRIRTLQRSFLFQDGGVLTDTQGRTANIIAVDVEAGNGVIHAIDAVVLPFGL